ncbi:MAG: hypothetical protein ETSY2_23920 [Candidatus Entotheonella gemina]|uniref:Uncharacterized protein n=1 Tax=Candidatus Entotheonella gemina TaxID=1429439 RepID=W4M545_9BACT|nr:MAG: hypothetical protein ETSY2_23920 [Candidatus Entotheonella gemina]
MFEWIAENKTLTAIATICSLLANVVGGGAWVWKSMSKGKDSTSKNEHFHIIDSDKSIEQDNYDDTRLISMPETLKPYGYFIFRGKQVVEGTVLNIVAVETIFVGIVGIPLIITFILQIPYSLQGVIAY